MLSCTITINTGRFLRRYSKTFKYIIAWGYGSLGCRFINRSVGQLKVSYRYDYFGGNGGEEVIDGEGEQPQPYWGF